jgi:hypothetical protein
MRIHPASAGRGRHGFPERLEEPRHLLGDRGIPRKSRQLALPQVEIAARERREIGGFGHPVPTIDRTCAPFPLAAPQQDRRIAQ